MAIHRSQLDQSSKQGRVVQACANCITAKTKCSNKRPCQRCRSKGLYCIDTILRPRRCQRDSFATTDDASPNDEAHLPCDDSVKMGVPSPPNSRETMSTSMIMAGPISERTVDVATSLSEREVDHSDATLDVSRDNPVASLDFGQITRGNSDSLSSNTFLLDTDTQNFCLPTDIFSLYHDSHFTLDAALQSLYSEPFVSNISDDFNVPFQESVSNADISLCGNASQGDYQYARVPKSSKASPWPWTLANRDHLGTDGWRVAVNETHILQSTEFNKEKSSSSHYNQIRETATRDEMLSMVSKFSSSPFNIRCFPSLAVLNSLTQTFFEHQDISIDSWIHSASFDPDTCRSELLAGIVAAGSTISTAPNIWRMGFALQKAVWLAACHFVSHDNSLIHNLQLNQTFLLWVEIGLWSGVRQKMEVSEGFASSGLTVSPPTSFEI